MQCRESAHSRITQRPAAPRRLVAHTDVGGKVNGIGIPWLSKSTRSRSKSASNISGSSAYRSRLALNGRSGPIATSPERSVRAISLLAPLRRLATIPIESPCNPDPPHVAARPVHRGSCSTPRTRHGHGRPRHRIPKSKPRSGIPAAAAILGKRCQARHFRGAHRRQVGAGELGTAGRMQRFPRCGSTRMVPVPAYSAATSATAARSVISQRVSVHLDVMAADQLT